MRALHFVTASAVSFLLALPLTANAGQIYEIDQISDLSATTPEQFYRFEPNYYWIKPGDTVRFLNSIGNHTVKTVDGIWPEGVETVDVAHNPSYQITLDKPGSYGFKCKIHNRHGMFGLIIVGEVEPQYDLWKNAALNDVGKRVFAALFEKFKTEYEARN